MSSSNPLAASIGSRVVDATAGEEIGFPVLIGTREYQVFWISLEGPIGVGKSTLLGHVANRLTSEYPLDIVEQVPENIEGMLKKGLFQKSQLEPKKYAFRVQVVWFTMRTRCFMEQWDGIVARLKNEQHMGINADRKRIFLVSERSVLSDPIFMETQYHEGHASAEELEDYLEIHAEWLRIFPAPPSLMIYCKTSIDICQKRVKERAREAEQNLVTREYNMTILNLHDRFMDIENGGFKYTKRGQLERIPVLVFDTAVNYRDDPEIARAASTEILQAVRRSPTRRSASSIRDSYSPPPPVTDSPPISLRNAPRGTQLDISIDPPIRNAVSSFPFDIEIKPVPPVMIRVRTDSNDGRALLEYGQEFGMDISVSLADSSVSMYVPLELLNAVRARAGMPPKGGRLTDVPRVKH